MVIHAVSLILALTFFCPVAWGGDRQACLSCHFTHYEKHGNCTGCHGGNGDSARENIAHSGLISGRYAWFTMGDSAIMKEGERLLEALACRRCHVSGGVGNRLATSLDSVVKIRTVDEIAATILAPGSEMPDLGLSEPRTDAVVNALLGGAKKKGSTVVKPLVVHFKGRGGMGKDVFSRKCGPCHRALTEKLGALGTGNSAPNLSGLLSPYYPKSYKTNGKWTEKALRQWLENPRKIRLDARMPPVPLKEDELRELVRILSVSGE